MFDYLHVLSDFEHEKKIKYKCLNQMKCKVSTVLHLVLLIKMKNIILNKIYWR